MEEGELVPHPAEVEGIAVKAVDEHVEVDAAADEGARAAQTQDF